VTSDSSLESGFGGRSSGAAGRRVWQSAGGQRFQVLRGTPEGDDVEVLGAAIDRMVALDRGQEPRPWTTSIRPGIGIHAWSPGSRWSQSLRSSWGSEP
jgi:hypothetical protein